MTAHSQRDRAAEDWSAKQYLKFADERTRPPRDLLAQVPLDSPRRIADLGCGPGNSTELLIERFPDAEVIGVDSSPDMLRQARAQLPSLKFVEADLSTWMPEPGTDLLFGNAVFHWVPGHPKVLARLLQSLPSGGVLAVQMPDNTNEPALMLMEKVAASLGQIQRSAQRPAASRELLRSAAPAVQPHRHLAHALQPHHRKPPRRSRMVQGLGDAAVPRAAERGDARDVPANYTDEIRSAYPARFDGKVMLKFPRLFILAVR